ncbi:hypothetical protein AVEN_128271-1 [Araneus ventricosus]|uniref:Uncharacterized protein n=1 Tax=Araneus ventricosus TaxID=182803 RepID=A0A4Y2FSB9_ARAVE|nr:hypothetical protein AVEN_128271-1 [Araneus ventricosus]
MMDQMWQTCGLTSWLIGPEPIGLFLLAAYEIFSDSAEDLVARIVVAADKTNTTPGIFERVRWSILRRCELCNDTSCRHFEHLLVECDPMVHGNYCWSGWVLSPLLFCKNNLDSPCIDRV